MKQIAAVLERMGLHVMEAYPSEGMLHLTKPAAAVELKGFHCTSGEMLVGVHILSPRKSGGLACQQLAVQAAKALHAEGMECSGSELKYLDRCDCFGVLVTVKIQTIHESGGEKEQTWTVLIDQQEVPYAAYFHAEQDQNRKLIEAVCQSEPVGVSPSSNNGWKIRLIRKIPFGKPIMALPREPFSLVVRRGGQGYRYDGCCWSGEKNTYRDTGTELEYWGFALKREALNGQIKI